MTPGRFFTCMAVATAWAVRPATGVWPDGWRRRSAAWRWSPTTGWPPSTASPAAVDDAVKAYRHLLGEGIEPGRIVIAGDSAGGGLTIAAAIAIRDSGLPQPGCLFAISPWANLGQSGAAYAAVLDDPMLTRQGLQDFADAYLQGEGPDHPLASPALGDLQGLPPMLLQAGGAEILASDTTLLAERAGLAGVEVRPRSGPR
jgi:monoterpene epsilon-lactone hydrolase